MKEQPGPHDLTFPSETITSTSEGKERKGQWKLGQILTQEGLLTGDELATTLAEQEQARHRRVGDLLVENRQVSREAVEQTLSKAARAPRGPQRVKIGEMLIAAGLITRDSLKEALTSLDQGRKEKLGALLIRKGLISEEQLLAALAKKFNLRFVNLEETRPSQAALSLIGKEMAIRMQVVPIEVRGRALLVATADPTDPLLEETLCFSAGCAIELVVATGQQIREAQQRFYAESDNRVDELIEEMADAIEVVEEETDAVQVNESDSTVIRLVNKVLLTAVSKRASDIHFEPGPGSTGLEIRYRVDGDCSHAYTIPANYKNAVISRLKILASLDIAERRKPQSGKIFLRSAGKRLEYRVEITPTAGGVEDAVLRVMANAKPIPLQQIGFSPHNLERFKALLLKPHGVILCVGPTGSGKTTTLHSALEFVNSPKRKIWTAEDPVEITQPGLRQVQINRKAGLSFSEALRSFLRADPDVIMVGEMRDPETAKIAVEASLTGHLVLSTLHTNSAAETIYRLLQVGVDPLHFADALLGIVGQRLVLKLCSDCKEPYRPRPDEYHRLIHSYGPELAIADRLPAAADNVILMRAKGCGKCSGTGYFGRTAIHELLEGTERLRQAIINRQPVSEIRRVATEDGMRFLRQDGILKVLEGQTTFEQVLKVCV